MKRVQECVSKRQGQISMDDTIHPNITGVCWIISQINQKVFSKIGDILVTNVSKL